MADVYVLISVSTNTILIFSHISDLKKKKDEPVVVSDSSDMCVFHDQVPFYSFYVILVRL